MRQADINRVNKAKAQLKAAIDTLSSIKWDNVSGLEYNLIVKAKDTIQEADWYLDDIFKIQ